MEGINELEGKNSTSEKAEKTLPVSRIHFLIHPGFTTDPKVLPENRDTLQRNEKLLEKYLESARSMKDREIMMAFIHSAPRRFLEDLKEGKAYAKTLQTLKSILGKRLIVLSNQFDIFDTPQAIEKAFEIARKRNFSFNENVASVAYGETNGLCVPDAAENFNRAAKLTQKTKILLSLTNASLFDVDIKKQEELLARMTQFHRDKTRIVFQEVGIPEI
jgi:hypothetical protein